MTRMTDDPLAYECDAPGCEATPSMLVAIGTFPLDDPHFPGATAVKLVCEPHKAHFQLDTEAQARFVTAMRHRIGGPTENRTTA